LPCSARARSRSPRAGGARVDPARSRDLRGEDREHARAGQGGARQPDQVARRLERLRALRPVLYAGGIVVVFQGEERVSSVVTTGLGDRTSNGIGVGSPEADVKAHIPGVKCETLGSARSCHTGRLVSGRKVTDFRIAAGKVASVFVGQVID